MKEQQQNLHQFPLPGIEESLQDGLFREFLPYSDLNQWIPEGTVYEHVIKNSPVLRLQYIRALSFLSYQGPQVENNYFLEFSHTRLDHSLVVALTTEHILRQNGILQEQINIGVLAALIHDIATPALGDATKKVDREALDEEEHWVEALGDKGIELLQRYGVSQPEIDDIIKNKGTIGKVLDIADRITYVMKDTYAVIGPVGKNNTYVNVYFNTSDLTNILNRFPKIGNIFQDVGVDQGTGQVFFNNPDRLEALLLLRALLHQKLYMHPISQARDMFIGKLLEPLYSRTDPQKFNPTRLRKMSDYELLQVIGNEYFSSKPSVVDYFPDLVNWFPRYERFDSQEQAEKRRQELSQNENIAVVGIKESKGFDPATSYKVADGYRYVEFREFNPEGARQIEEIAESTKGIFLFWTDVSNDSPTNNLLRAVLKK